MFPAGAGAGAAEGEEEIHELSPAHSCSLGFLPCRHSDINISQLRPGELLQTRSQSEGGVSARPAELLLQVCSSLTLTLSDVCVPVMALYSSKQDGWGDLGKE